MSAKLEDKTVTPEITLEKTSTTDSPLLLEIKAQVEKLSGQVDNLLERVGKAKEPEKYPPEKKPEEKKAETPVIEVKAKKPEDEVKPEEKKPEEEKQAPCAGKKPEEYPYPDQKKQFEKIMESLNATAAKVDEVEKNFTTFQKAFEEPVKRTTVLTPQASGHIDVSKMSYKEIADLVKEIE